MHDAASVVDASRGTATAAHHCDSIPGAGPEPKAAAERRAAAAGRGHNNDDDDHGQGKTSLELHGLVMQNGHARLGSDYVSDSSFDV